MSKVHSVAMALYCARRANQCELVPHKPERQDELRSVDLRWTDHTHCRTLSCGLC